MPLVRCSEQNRQTLEEFYSEWASEPNEVSARLGECMLKVIELIDTTFVETQLYGLTSHAHLLLLSENDSMSDWHVALIGNSEEYVVEYRITDENQSQRNPSIKVVTKSIEEFKNALIIALLESQGWTKNNELNKLFSQIKI